MDDRTATVYAIRNTVTGECYIGGTTNMSKRRCHHLYYLRRGEHANRNLQAAFNQYGEDAFEFQDIMKVLPDDIVAWEDAAIFVHDPAYNIFPNAGSALGYTHTAEARAKMSACKMGNTNLLGRRHSPETRAKMSAVKMGKKRGPFAPEHRAKIAASMRAYHAQRRADCVV